MGARVSVHRRVKGVKNKLIVVGMAQSIRADLPPDEKRAYAGRDTPKEEALHHVGTARYR